MNKLLGFYELKAMNLPAVPWEEYTGKESLDEGLLWTVRSAVYHGDDLNLPRAVGVGARDGEKFASDLLKQLDGKGMVLFYPYFVAAKSGTMNIYSDRIVIEAVKDDLWKLVTFSEREVTMIITDAGIRTDGNGAFLSEMEREQLLRYVPEVKRKFRDELHGGESVMLEWSFAYNCDMHKRKRGAEYLVFYEARTL